MRRIVLAILFLLASASAAAAKGDICAKIVGDFVEDASRLTSGMAHEEFEYVRKKAKLPASVILCGFEGRDTRPHARPAKVKDRFVYGVFIARVHARTLEREGMRGIIAHEMGHVYLWSHLSFGAFVHVLAGRRNDHIERTADAAGAEWVGAPTMVRGLLAAELMVVAEDDFSQRAMPVRKEVTTRIRALWAFDEMLKKRPAERKEKKRAPKGARSFLRYCTSVREA
jgi:hypothetical protein